MHTIYIFSVKLLLYNQNYYETVIDDLLRYAIAIM
jgi:hypothetical protein